jgi:hypothetical protein
MITWLSTLAPLTQSRRSSTRGISGSTIGFGGDAITIKTFGTTTNNWSRTDVVNSYSQSYENNTGSTSSASNAERQIEVLGTVNSTQTNGSVVNITRRSVLDITTTASSQDYTYRSVYSTTSTFSAPFTTSVSNDISTTSVAFIYSVPTTSQIATTTSEIITTTTFDGIVDTPIHATIIQAGPNEVIWHADTSAATDITNCLIASSYATSATEITLLPLTDTVVAGTVNSIQEYTNSPVSGVLTYDVLEYDDVNISTTTIIDYNEFPNRTESTEWIGGPTAVETTMAWNALQSGPTPLWNNATAETIVIEVPTIFTGYTDSFSYRESTQTTQTTTKYVQAPYALSSSHTKVESFYDGFLTSEVTAVTSQENALLENVTAHKYPIQGITTSINYLSKGISRVIEFGNGVNVPSEYSTMFSDGIAAGYSINAQLGFINNASAFHKRNVRTVRPIETINANGNYRVTFEGANVTYQHTSATNTSFAALIPFQETYRTKSIVSHSCIIGNGLRSGETLYATTLPGAYAMSDLTTTKNLVASTYTVGPVSDAFTEISAIVQNRDAYANTANYLWWIAPKNPVQFSRDGAPLDITAAEAYEQV